MQNATQTVCRNHILLILVLSLFGTVTASDKAQSYCSDDPNTPPKNKTCACQADGPPEITRRSGESEASYMARLRAAERAWAAKQSRIDDGKLRITMERRRGESDASYQARLRAKEREVTAARSTVKVIRRRGESEASYQARLRAAERASKSQRPSLLEKQPESDAIYQARLKLTIRGLLNLFTEEVHIKQRKGESEASYQARCRAAARVQKSQTEYLIANPGENEQDYLNRLEQWKIRNAQDD